MDTVSSQGSAKRRRLDPSVNSLLNPTSTTAPNPDTIFHAQPVPYGNTLDAVQVADPWTYALHPNQQNNGHPRQYHRELPFSNDFDVILADDTHSNSPTTLYNHALRDERSVLQPISFQCQFSNEETPLSIPNPLNEDQSVGDKGSEIVENTMICYGMVSI
jgi:hypothetical protein